MNVTENKVDELNLELTVSIVKDDYADKKKKKLSEIRRNVDIKGFRKGMVPPALIAKMYGERVLVDAVNDVISETLGNYIQDNNLKVVGEPLPSEDQPKTEWVDGNDFTFKFDVALYPEINFELNDSDSVPQYTIIVSEKAKAEMKENVLKQYGSLADGEAAGEQDFIIVDFEQGDTKVEGTYVAIRNVAEDVRPAFVGIKPGDVLNVNVNEAFVNETDRSSMLKLTKDELQSRDPEWKMTVVNVKTFVNAELNQETFDKVFGEGNVKSEAEFDAKLEERLRSEYEQESDYQFKQDLKKYIIEKADVKLPDAFLKRWLLVANEGKFTKEDIEKEWDVFAQDYKWQLVCNHILNKYDVKIEDADYMASAKGYAAYQFAMYGMNDVPEEQLESFAKNILSQEKESRRIAEMVETDKALEAVKPLVSVSKKRISVDKFRELK